MFEIIASSKDIILYEKIVSQSSLDLVSENELFSKKVNSSVSSNKDLFQMISMKIRTTSTKL